MSIFSACEAVIRKKQSCYQLLSISDSSRTFPSQEVPGRSQDGTGRDRTGQDGTGRDLETASVPLYIRVSKVMADHCHVIELPYIGLTGTLLLRKLHFILSKTLIECSGSSKDPLHSHCYHVNDCHKNNYVSKGGLHFCTEKKRPYSI